MSDLESLLGSGLSAVHHGQTCAGNQVYVKLERAAFQKAKSVGVRPEAAY
mgnify:CR=1 FL=1|jgi:hypothetical protein